MQLRQDISAVFSHKTDAKYCFVFLPKVLAAGRSLILASGWFGMRDHCFDMGILRCPDREKTVFSYFPPLAVTPLRGTGLFRYSVPNLFLPSRWEPRMNVEFAEALEDAADAQDQIVGSPGQAFAQFACW